MYLGVFFLYPDKLSFVIPGLPFLLILVLYLPDFILYGVVILTFAGCFVQVDIFRNRVLVDPYLTSGSYASVVSRKPFYTLDYLRRSLSQCDGGAVAVFVDAWDADFLYNINRGALPVTQEQVAARQGIPVWAFHPVDRPRSVLLPRDSAMDADLLASYRARGYKIKMDRDLYRFCFLRYNVTAHVGGAGRIGDVPVELFGLGESPSD